MLLLVLRGVVGIVGPGRCVCRRAAARPLAVRAASFARRVVSKPGQAPPPPTGTAAGPFGALHAGGAVLLCVAECVGSKPGQAPQATRRPPIGRGVCVLPGQAPPPPTGPSGPSGALHAGGAVLLCVAERVGSKPGQAPAQRQFRMQFPRMCFMV